MTKTELLGALRNALNNFVYGLVISRHVPDETWSAIATTTASFRGPQGDMLYINLAPLCKNMSNPKDRKIVIEEYENCLKRAATREGHELLLLYCEETNQFPLYKSQSWFQFARIIRNVSSHKQGGILKKWPDDLTRKGITQVSWRSRTLDISMVGSEIDFTIQEALQLLGDQIEFAMTTLA